MKTRDLTQVGIFAAIIYLTVAFFKIPVGPQMVHLGNAMVVVGALVFGVKKGTLSAAIGLFLFDVTHGWAAVAWITVLESVIVCIMIYIFFERLMQKKDAFINVAAIGIIAAITKIVLNLLKYTFLYGMMTQGLEFAPALSMAVAKITGTFGSAILTAVMVPILYPVIKRITTQVYGQVNQ